MGGPPHWEVYTGLPTRVSIPLLLPIGGFPLMVPQVPAMGVQHQLQVCSCVCGWYFTVKNFEMHG